MQLSSFYLFCLFNYFLFFVLVLSHLSPKNDSFSGAVFCTIAFYQPTKNTFGVTII